MSSTTPDPDFVRAVDDAIRVTRARDVAGTLHLSPDEQAVITTAAVDLVYRPARRRHPVAQIVGDVLAGAGVVLFCLLVAVVVYAWGSAPASATEDATTLELAWVLPDGGTPDRVTWPQAAATDATCSPDGTTVWLQLDTYPYATTADKARTDALADDGVLTYGEDHGWALSWRFAVAPPCPTTEPTQEPTWTPTATPTETTTSTPTPSPTSPEPSATPTPTSGTGPSPTASTPTSSRPTPPSSPSPTTASPRVTPSTSSTPSTAPSPTPTSAAPSATPSAAPPCATTDCGQLAHTGAGDWIAVAALAAAVAVLAGIAIVAAVSRRRR
ncbi:hypothetical protein [Cellulomonas sp. HZM]|uniref:hypothetical protein n=1 Tax=Cellulomonas sp. HZM TaxID=1454010 RepID=UPI00069028A1|nr:hypothetical protein [Cellulomonas sp. HZM]